MEEGRFMSVKEAKRYATICAVLDKRITQRQAAADLRLSRRQVIRLCQAVGAAGAQALASKKRGRPSNRRIKDEERQRIVAIVQGRYADFGPQLAAEYLRQGHGFTASVETLRAWLIGAGLWTPRLRRAKRVHPARPRRERLGELVQIDGSHHDWFEGRAPQCCVIAFIDDATSRVLAGRFSDEETTQDYFAVLNQSVQRHGVPLALYSDRHGIFTKADADDPKPTQFERALLQLGIEPIQARTPQAKGRVERLFQTWQDRLIKAMRLAGIKDMSSANAWLPSYIAAHNDAFAVAPNNPLDAHRPWQRSQAELARICAKHHDRQLGANLSCRFEGAVIQVHAEQAHLPKGKAQVGLVQYADERLEVIYRGHSLAHTAFTLHPHLANKRAHSAKTLNPKVDQVVLKARRELAKTMAQIAHQDAQRASAVSAASARGHINSAAAQQ